MDMAHYTRLMVRQAAWVRFTPSTEAADSSSWQLFKLGRPISPTEVIVNGSYSQHAISDEGVTVNSAGAGAVGPEQLNIRCAAAFIAQSWQTIREYHCTSVYTPAKAQAMCSFLALTCVLHESWWWCDGHQLSDVVKDF